MSKNQYFRLALSMPIDWLLSVSDAERTPHMRPIHSAIIKLAIRRKSREF